MFCPNCGAQIKDGCLFCTNCGARQNAESAPAAQAPAYTAPQQETYAPQQETYTPETYDDGSAYTYDPYSSYSAGSTAAPKKSLSTGMLIGIIAAALAAIVLIAGFATNWFGLTGPMMQIVSAANKTLNADNFTAVFITPDMEMSAQIELDLKKQELTLVAVSKDSDSVMAIYDGYMITVSEGYYYAEDISDTLDEIFDAYEEMEEEGVSIDDLFDMLDSYGMLDGIDEDKLEKCITTYGKKLNSTSWLKKNAGFSKGKMDGHTAYTFEPDIIDFLVASLEILEPAFEDEDYYEEVLELVEDLDDSYMPEIKASILTKGGKLTGLIADMGEDEWIEVYFEDIGKTDIDYDWLEEILDEAEY